MWVGLVGLLLKVLDEDDDEEEIEKRRTKDEDDLKVGYNSK